MRKSLRRKTDRRVFRKTANKVPKSMLSSPAMRGGLMR